MWGVRHWVFWVKFLLIGFFIGHIGYLVLGVAYDRLGANPVEALTHITGEWALYLLLLTLAITPVRRLFHWNVLSRFRRLLGVWSFVYASLHLSVFLLFDHFFDWLSIIDDIVERPYITFGFAAYVFMLPLAVTSLHFWQKRMGKAWISLHRLVYLVAVLVILHYWWLVKADVLWPLVYALLLSVLLGVRVFFRVKKSYR
ncbi:sulfite oxidase heme-binding subunit YedZ [Eionea flava]